MASNYPDWSLVLPFLNVVIRSSFASPFVDVLTLKPASSLHFSFSHHNHTTHSVRVIINQLHLCSYLLYSLLLSSSCVYLPSPRWARIVWFHASLINSNRLWCPVGLDHLFMPVCCVQLTFLCRCLIDNRLHLFSKKYSIVFYSFLVVF